MSSSRLVFWSHLTSKSIAAMDLSRAVAILPVGAIEQHGPHLPVSTDTDIVNGLVEAMKPRLGSDAPQVLVLPTQPVGKSDEHLRYPGTLTLSPETLLRLWSEIGASVARAGVRRIMLLNSHGGQTGPLEIVARELRVRHAMLAVACNWFHLGLPSGLFSDVEVRFGIHAGDMETSMMLALHPERVDMAHARDFRSASEQHADVFKQLGRSPGARIGWQMQDLNPAGAAGNAGAATPEKGRQVIAYVADRLVEVVQDMAAYDLQRLDEAPAW